MKTKIVYVLVSDGRGYYLEQTLISVYSLRLYNTDAHVMLVTDHATIDAHDPEIVNDLLSYFDEVKYVDTEYETAKERSRALKTTLRNTVAGDFFYIDSDTVVCGCLDEVDMIDAPLSMALDGNIEKREIVKYTSERWRRDFWGGVDLDEFYNCGIIYAKDCEEAHTFFVEWHRMWKESLKTGKCIDQPPAYRAISNLGIKIKRLDDRLNCQLKYNFLPYLSDAKIVHTLISNPSSNMYLLNDKNIFYRIREAKCIPDDIKEIAANGRAAFKVTGPDSYCTLSFLMLTGPFQRVKRTFTDFPLAFKIIDKLSHCVMACCLLKERFLRK